MRDSMSRSPNPPPAAPNGAGAAGGGATGQNILDRPLNKTRGSEVALASWAFMFAEIVSYSQSRVDSVADLEQR
jgi:hypothetical protein